MAALSKARWSDPEYRDRARGFRRDDKVYHWRNVQTGETVRRTRLEMREEYGLKADGLDAVVAVRSQTTRGWGLVPKPRMPAGPKWIFP